MHNTEYQRILDTSTEEKQDKHDLQRQNQFNQIPQKSIEDAIVEFIVKERLPISKMNSTHLNKLIDGINLRFVSENMKFCEIGM